MTLREKIKASKELKKYVKKQNGLFALFNIVLPMLFVLLLICFVCYYCFFFTKMPMLIATNFATLENTILEEDDVTTTKLGFECQCGNCVKVNRYGYSTGTITNNDTNAQIVKLFDTICSFLNEKENYKFKIEPYMLYGINSVESSGSLRKIDVLYPNGNDIYSSFMYNPISKSPASYFTNEDIEKGKVITSIQQMMGPFQINPNSTTKWLMECNDEVYKRLGITKNTSITNQKENAFYLPTVAYGVFANIGGKQESYDKTLENLLGDSYTSQPDKIKQYVTFMKLCSYYHGSGKYTDEHPIIYNYFLDFAKEYEKNKEQFENLPSFNQDGAKNNDFVLNICQIIDKDGSKGYKTYFQNYYPEGNTSHMIMWAYGPKAVILGNKYFEEALIEADAVQGNEEVWLCNCKYPFTCCDCHSNDTTYLQTLNGGYTNYQIGVATKENFIRAACSLVGKVRYGYGGGHGGNLCKIQGINPLWERFNDLYLETNSLVQKAIQIVTFNHIKDSCICNQEYWCPVHGTWKPYSNSYGCSSIEGTVKTLDDFINQRKDTYNFEEEEITALKNNEVLKEAFGNGGFHPHYLETLDCSSYVSWVFNQVSSTPKYMYSTSDFPRSTDFTKITDQTTLRCGDILNKSGDHVIIVLGKMFEGKDNYYLLIEQTPPKIQFSVGRVKGNIGLTNPLDDISAKSIVSNLNKKYGNQDFENIVNINSYTAYRWSGWQEDNSSVDSLYGKDIITRILGN